MTSVYREQEFVERCHCGVATIGPCGSCGHARCAAHLEAGLCNRCTQMLAREMSARSNRRFVVSCVVGAGFTLATLMVHLSFGILIGAPLAATTYFGLRRRQRTKLIARMGPALAAMKGELPPVVHTYPIVADDGSAPSGGVG